MDTDAVRAWIAANADALTTVDPRSSPADLEPLAAVVGDAAIVALGSSTRFAHELWTLSHRALRFLVETMGFRSLVLEEDWSRCIELDRFAQGAHGSAEEVLDNIWRPHRIRELRDVLVWLRAYNDDHREDPVRIAGADVTRLDDPVFHEIERYVRDVAPERLGELSSHLIALRSVLDARGGDERADAHELLDHAKRVRKVIEAVSGNGSGVRGAMVLQHASVVIHFFEYRLDEDLAYAERQLAELTTWWHRHTGHKIVYWGGMGHTANARRRRFSPSPTPRTMRNAGSHLRGIHRDRYRSIALTFDRGQLPYPVPPPPAVFADAPLGGVGFDAYLLDLRAPAAPTVRAWLESESKVRLIGPTFEADRNADYHMAGGSLSEWFDAVIHCQQVTATRSLD